MAIDSRNLERETATHIYTVDDEMAILEFEEEIVAYMQDGDDDEGYDSD